MSEWWRNWPGLGWLIVGGLLAVAEVIDTAARAVACFLAGHRLSLDQDLFVCRRCYGLWRAPRWLVPAEGTPGDA